MENTTVEETEIPDEDFEDFELVELTDPSELEALKEAMENGEVTELRVVQTQTHDADSPAWFDEVRHFFEWDNEVKDVNEQAKEISEEAPHWWSTWFGSGSTESGVPMG